MKKNFKTLLTSLMLLTLGLTGCQNVQSSVFDNTDPNNKYVTSVTLDNDYLSLEIGEEVTLTPTVTVVEGFEGEYQKMWKSSRPSVASVTDAGLVTTRSAGTASISYIAGFKMASCTIVVHGGSTDPTHEEEQPKEVNITLNVASKTLSIGDTFLLIATVTDGSIPTWSSADDEIATVNQSGLVTAVAAGEVDIVATVNDKSARCHITVNDPSVVPPEDPGDDEKTCTIYFFLDYNNIDERDTTGKKLLKTFKWYGNIPISESGLVPEDPTEPADPAFPYFVGWSSHTIIDTVNDLWNMSQDTVGNEYFFYLYGIWSDVPAGGFVK